MTLPHWLWDPTVRLATIGVICLVVLTAVGWGFIYACKAAWRGWARWRDDGDDSGAVEGAGPHAWRGGGQ